MVPTMLHLHQWRERARADDGFSLAEVLIGAFVSMVALAGLAQTLIATTASQGKSERSVTASQLAAQEVEKIQSLDWTLVGLYASDGAASSAVVDGVSRPTVLLSGTPGTGYRPLPATTTTVQNTAYTLRTSIVWDDSAVHPPVAPNGSRKRILVDVSWTSRGRTRSVTAASLRAWPPVQRGPSLLYLVLATSGPPAQLIDEYGYPVSTMVDGQPVSAVTLTGVTNRQADSVAAAWTPRPGGTGSVTLSQTGTELTWTALLSRPASAPVAGLGPNATSPVVSPAPNPDYRFANGATNFQITASAPGFASDSRVVSTTFLHDQVYVVPGTVSASRPFCKRTNNQLQDAVDVEFEVQGFQAADRASVSWISTGAGVSTGLTSAQHVSLTTRGARQRVTIARNTPLPGTTISFTFVTNRTSALPVTGLVQAPVSFAIGNNGTAPC